MRTLLENYTAEKSLYARMLAPVYQQYQLTYMELSVLLFLANNPAFDTAAQIVKYRQLTKSHVSISLKALQQRGLLVGEQRPDDRRTVHLKLTDAAQPIIDDGRQAQQAFLRQMLAGFTPEEIRLYQDFLTRIHHNLTARPTP